MRYDFEYEDLRWPRGLSPREIILILGGMRNRDIRENIAAYLGQAEETEGETQHGFQLAALLLVHKELERREGHESVE